MQKEKERAVGVGQNKKGARSNLTSFFFPIGQEIKIKKDKNDK